jgi:dienelactone hydrolase
MTTDSTNAGAISAGLVEDNLPAWHREALGALDFPLGWKKSITDHRTWKKKGQEAFKSLLLQNLEPKDPEPRVEAVEKRSGYEVRRISVRLSEFCRVKAYLAIPEGEGPFPAAVLLHDHGGFFEIGKEKMILPIAGYGKTDVARTWMDKNYGGRSIGDDLAKQGYVVFASDALGWGDRACGGYDTQQAIACNLFGMGSSWAGLIAAEDIASVDYLASLPFVDSKRIACIGHSMGGFRSWQLAALSDKITAAISICSFGTIQGLMAPGGNRLRGQSAYAMTHPGLSRLMDFPDIAGLAAPKPIYILNGLEDKLSPVECVREAYEKTQSVYRAFGYEVNFLGEFRQGGHLFTAEDQDKAFQWLRGQWKKIAD